jgi:HlyD family secretion protein
MNKFNSFSSKGQKSQPKKFPTLALIGLLWICALVLSGCQNIASSTPQQTPVPIVKDTTGVIVEGNLVPNEFVNLSYNIGGTIAKVLISEGDTIEAGQVIAQLDQHDRLAAAVANADLDLTNARQALKTLQDNSNVDTAAKLQGVADARDAVREAERYLNNLKSGSRGTDLQKAQANVVLLNDRLKTAREDYAPYQNKPGDNVTRARYLSILADAQRKYDDAVRLLNNLEGNPSDIDMAVAQANLLLAQAKLTLAEKDYQDVKNGPDPDQLELDQAHLTAAEAALTAAKKSLSDSELVAPLSGTVVQLDLKEGEQAIPGKLAAVIADFSTWKVETKDLNEMDVPSIHTGQAVQVTPDALPDLKLAGKVESISQFSVEKFGDVTYTAKINLDEVDPDLRWGMTVKVHFQP